LKHPLSPAFDVNFATQSLPNLLCPFPSAINVRSKYTALKELFAPVHKIVRGCKFSTYSLRTEVYNPRGWWNAKYKIIKTKQR
jgi:hypothetical protein